VSTAFLLLKDMDELQGTTRAAIDRTERLPVVSALLGNRLRRMRIWQ
jgi:hypothetical protein